uniref:Synaptosome associated protein 91 n=1 Tax=Takifugu rubripes TaxID=31033 RepID=A0A674MFX0_TAKRU
MSGQTLTDRIAAAQYSLTGSEVSRAVCKATTHEQTAPKKKHMEYLIQASQDQTNVNVPQMVDTLMERVGNASWVVVFKALITTHHLMVHGHEKFLQLLSSRNTLFNLSNFLDKTGSHGFDMSTFIRRYGRYLNEKSFAYRQMSFDFVRVKKGAEGAMRTMTVEKLLKGMPILQSQIDALLDFEVQPKDLNNGVINACFLLLFKDLIKLYACYNDGIINLLEKFFQMKRSQCKDGLEIYKRFLTRMTRVSDFFKIAEQMGIDKNDIPELTQAPETSEASLTNGKSADAAAPAASAAAPAAPVTAVSAPAAPPASLPVSTRVIEQRSKAVTLLEYTYVFSVFQKIEKCETLRTLLAKKRIVPTGEQPPRTCCFILFIPKFLSAARDANIFLLLVGLTNAFSFLVYLLPTLRHHPPPKDPFATTEGSGNIAPELDLFAMRPSDTGGATPSASTEEPPVVTPIAAPIPAPTASSTTITTTTADTADTTDTTTTESAAAPPLDIFGDMFDSMPAQSPTTESKAATTPSVDLFGAGTRVEIHFSVWNLFISPGFCASTPLPPPPHMSWFVSHCGLRIVHVTHSSSRGFSS